MRCLECGIEFDELNESQPVCPACGTPPGTGRDDDDISALLDDAAVRCVLSDERSLTLSRFLTSFIRPSDQLEFDPTAADPMRELRVVQSTTRRPRELYFVPIAYVTQPKPDKRGEYFVRAEIT